MNLAKNHRNHKKGETTPDNVEKRLLVGRYVSLQGCLSGTLYKLVRMGVCIHTFLTSQLWTTDKYQPYTNVSLCNCKQRILHGITPLKSNKIHRTHRNIVHIYGTKIKSLHTLFRHSVLNSKKTGDIWYIQIRTWTSHIFYHIQTKGLIPLEKWKDGLFSFRQSP